MSFKKAFISIILFYFLVLFQTSFLVHFNLFGIVPNIALILAILWPMLEKEERLLSFGVFNAFVAGFFLDIFSSRPFGLYLVILLVLSIITKQVIKKRVRVPFSKTA